jgi:K+-sensing histidine kinase KdpD
MAQTNDEDRRLQRFLHEVKMSLVTINAIARHLEHELCQRQIATKHDYAGEISSMCHMTLQLLDASQRVWRLKDGQAIRLDRTLCWLRRDIIAPVIRQASQLLAQKDMRAEAIVVSRFEQIPALYVDRRCLQHVFFSLLDNAIKYAYRNPQAFRVEILAEMDAEAVSIAFRDFGPGISEESCLLVSPNSFCAPNAAQANTHREGSGLWVVQRILAAHGGSIEVTSRRNPTAFKIRLPTSLQHPEIPTRSTDL